MSKVFANGRSILHKGAGNTHVSAAPDVCKVPTPGGPVPTPFVNSAQDSMLAKGSKSVSIDGNPVALTSSELSTSSGDEPGTAGGLISSKFQGKMTWGSGSVDVKVEGKGVVRFLDPTLHNGNTFNTSFISAGGTGLAYGDDTQCTACGKPVDDHRVLETPEAVARIGEIFMKLTERYDAQRPLLDRYFALRERRAELDGRLRNELDAVSSTLESRKQRRLQLAGQMKNASAEEKKEMGLLQQEIKTAEKEIKDARGKFNVEDKALLSEMEAVNAELLQARPVLGKDDQTGTFTKGYMLGMCICKCPESPKMLVACSGRPPPGLPEVVSQTDFTFVESFQMSARQEQALAEMPDRNAWDCAAPKLLQAGGAAGHKVRTMSERLFSPFQGLRPQRVKVTYSHTEGEVTNPAMERSFGHAESVPSCDACQQLTPEMLCDNQKECA